MFQTYLKVFPVSKSVNKCLIKSFLFARLTATPSTCQQKRKINVYWYIYHKARAFMIMYPTFKIIFQRTHELR